MSDSGSSDPASLLVFAALVCFFVWSSRRSAQLASERQRRLLAIAEERGLGFADRATVPLAAFRLFQNGGWLSNAIYDEEDPAVVGADWTFPLDRGSETVSIAAAGAPSLPYCAVRRRDSARWEALDRLAGIEVAFESEAFNRAFVVSADDDAAAHAILDGRTLEWLLVQDERYVFETGTAGVIVASSLLDPDEMPALMQAARGFARIVPSQVTLGATDQRTIGTALAPPQDYSTSVRIGNVLVGGGPSTPTMLHELRQRPLSSHGKRVALRIAGGLAFPIAFLLVSQVVTVPSRFSWITPVVVDALFLVLMVRTVMHKTSVPQD